MKIFFRMAVCVFLSLTGCATVKGPSIPHQTKLAINRSDAKALERARNIKSIDEAIVAYEKAKCVPWAKREAGQKWDELVYAEIAKVDTNDVDALLEIYVSSREESPPWKEIREMLKPHFGVYW